MSFQHGVPDTFVPAVALKGIPSGLTVVVFMGSVQWQGRSMQAVTRVVGLSSILYTCGAEHAPVEPVRIWGGASRDGCYRALRSRTTARAV